MSSSLRISCWVIYFGYYSRIYRGVTPLNEFAWLVHVGILDGVKKNNSRQLLNYNK